MRHNSLGKEMGGLDPASGLTAGLGPLGPCLAPLCPQSQAWGWGGGALCTEVWGKRGHEAHVWPSAGLSSPLGLCPFL